MTSFGARLLANIDQRSPFCLGLDPSAESLARAGVDDDPTGVESFCERLLDASLDVVAAVKPQMAYFERFGPPGVEALARVCERVRDAGVPVILDGKRGDIGSTMAAYGAEFFGDSAPLRADCVTVAAYMGIGALEPLFERMAADGGGAFVVVCSSNADGLPLQTARTDDGRMVAEWLADEIAASNERSGDEVGPIGAVIGATCGDWARPVLERLRGAPVLAPGLGAQGGTFDQAARLFEGVTDRVLLPMSRAVVADGAEPAAVRERVLEYAELARRFKDIAVSAE